MNVRRNFAMQPCLQRHAQVRLCHSIDVQTVEGWPEYRDELRRKIQHLPELGLLLLQPLFGLLALVDVRQQDIPASDCARRVPQWPPAGVKPAVRSVEPPQTMLDIVR